MSLTFDQVEDERKKRGIPVERWAIIIGIHPVYYRSIRDGKKPWNLQESTERSIRKAIGLPSPRFKLYCDTCGVEAGDYCMAVKGYGQASDVREGCPYWEKVGGLIQRKR